MIMKNHSMCRVIRLGKTCFHCSPSWMETEGPMTWCASSNLHIGNIWHTWFTQGPYQAHTTDQLMLRITHDKWSIIYAFTIRNFKWNWIKLASHSSFIGNRAQLPIMKMPKSFPMRHKMDGWNSNGWKFCCNFPLGIYMRNIVFSQFRLWLWKTHQTLKPHKHKIHYLEDCCLKQCLSANW